MGRGTTPPAGVINAPSASACTPEAQAGLGIAHVCGSPPGTPPLIPTIAGARALAELSHTSARLRLPLSAPSAESCWRVKHWTPRRASRSGVVAPDAAMPWCVRVCQRAARPSPMHATSNRVVVIRAVKGGGVSARFAITHAPHQRAPEKVFYLFTRLPCTPSTAGARAPVPPRRALQI
jgi:hypothetical protein